MTNAHIEVDWSGETVSVAFKDRVYHFKRRGVGFYLDVVDLLDSDESVDGRLVRPPNRVISSLQDKNVSVIHE